MAAGRLYLSVLCRCCDERCQAHGVDGGGAAAADVHSAAVTRHRGGLLAAVDDDDEDGDLRPPPRLRFEITFHRPCGSQRRRQQRRQGAVEQGASSSGVGRQPTEARPGETIELEIVPCVSSVPADDRSTSRVQPRRNFNRRQTV